MKANIFIALMVGVGFAVLQFRPGSDQILNPAVAASIFHEARVLSEKDGSSLWGIPLYGPMLLVDPSSWRVIANEPDSESFLRANGSVFVGDWPKDKSIANTAVEWSGKRWTMLMWPVSGNTYDRRALIAHELWHRVQDDIGLPSQGGPTMHLGSRDGRYWLQMEWRALAVGLQTNISRSARKDTAALAARNDEWTGSMRFQGIHDALAFRSYRRSLFPDAAEAENALEMHEGLAQYTGFALSGRSPHLNRESAARELKRAESNATFVRSFAYASGPAYGLLLDQSKPDWRNGLSADTDLGVLLADAYGITLSDDPAEDVGLASSRYNGKELAVKEDLIEEEREAKLADMRKKFVTGPVLELPFFKMKVQFDPGKILALDDIGNVYLSLRLVDEWGILTSTDGALIMKDWSMTVVPAPENIAGSVVKGVGYALELNEGWKIEPLEDKDGYAVRKTE